MNKKLINYFNGDTLAASIWLQKYAYKNEVTPNDMHKRMAREFIRIEQKYQHLEKHEDKHKLSEYGKNREHLNFDKIFELFKDFKYIIPQGSVMATLGTDYLASLSNCWVVDEPEDSYASILKTDAEAVFLYKRRGGVGTGISKLRPKNTFTNNSAKSSTGAVSFMDRFSSTVKEVAQSGRE